MSVTIGGSMRSFISIMRKGAFIATTFLAGLCLVMLLFFMTVKETTLKSEFHKNLFDKNQIYSVTQNTLNKTVSYYISELDKVKTQDSAKQKELLMLLQKSITSEDVRHNLDSVREELFQYLKGERKFLPDIRVNTQPFLSGKDFSGFYNGTGIPLDSFSGINKISLSTILQYVNRDDISNCILVLKLFYYIVNVTPGFFLLGLVFFTLVGLILCKKPSEIFKWLSYTLLQLGIMCAVLLAALITYSYSILPSSIYPLEMALPLGKNVILDYFHDCFSPLYLTLSAVSVISICMFFVLIFIPRFLMKRTNINSRFKFVKKLQEANSEPVDTGNPAVKKHHYSNYVYIVLIAAILTGIGFKIHYFKRTFEQNDFSYAFNYLRNANAVTEVIAAKNEAVYTLQVKAVDSKTDTPLPGLKVNVSGRSAITSKTYDITAATDQTGIAKFSLDKGEFRLSYLTADFPTGLQIPASYFFELKTAGTTIITSSINEAKEKEMFKTGIAEIEVLDEKNNPVSGLELQVLGRAAAEGYPDYIYSITGSDGIASFKISEGNYNISFAASKFPSIFKLPPPITVEVKPDSISRYTLRLVKSSP